AGLVVGGPRSPGVRLSGGAYAARPADHLPVNHRRATTADRWARGSGERVIRSRWMTKGPCSTGSLSRNCLWVLDADDLSQCALDALGDAREPVEIHFVGSVGWHVVVRIPK